MIHLLLAVTLEAQQHFNAGLMDLFGYASDAAVAEFDAAAKADPTFALPFWGKALALGSDLNTPLTAEGYAAAQKAIEGALGVATSQVPRDEDLIEAVQLRYRGPFANASENEKAYRTAMERHVQRYPTDDDATMFLVEDLLETKGMHWNDDGTPLGDTSKEILSLIQRTLARNPQHVFANHLCIHAYDNAPDRTAAIACAQTLDALPLAPPLEHLAHMPAHLWIELGDGEAALRSSERAWNLAPTKYAEHDAYVALSAAFMCGDRSAIATWAKRLGDLQGQPVSLALPPRERDAQRLEQRGDVDGAIAVLQKDVLALVSAEEMIPWYPADVRVGAIQFRAGRYQAARDTFEEILKHRPRDPRALFGAAHAAAKLGDVASAAKYQDDFTRYWAGTTLTMNDF